MKRKKTIWLTFLLLGLAVGGLDLWTKHTVFKLLHMEVITPGERPLLHNTSDIRDDRGFPVPKNIVVIPGYFELEAALNYGAFSGWFGRHTGALAGLSLLALFFIAGFLFLTVHGGKPVPTGLVLALGFLWGGTLGNFYDRYFIGGVRDFVKWFIVIDGEAWVWPNFNIADSAICIGVGLIILREVLRMIRGTP